MNPPESRTTFPTEHTEGRDAGSVSPLGRSVVRAVAALSNPRRRLVVIRAIEFEAAREDGGLVETVSVGTYREHERDVQAAIDRLRKRGVLDCDLETDRVELAVDPERVDVDTE